MDEQLFMDALVRALYRAILKREPEPAVYALQSRERLSQDYDLAIERLVAGFLESDEYKARFSRAAQPEFLSETWVAGRTPGGLTLWLDLSDYGVSRPCLQGAYERNETAFVLDFLQPGMTFVDIGANIGWFTVQAAEKVGPAGRVVAFEPRSNTFAALKASIEANGFSGRAELLRAAVGPEPGAGRIGWHGAGNPGGTWSLSEDLASDFAASGGVIEETPVVTLDQVVGDRPVNLIKIDIEGAEPLATRGAREVLSRARPTILSEVNFEILPIVSGMNAAGYFELMRSLGYVAHALTENGPGERLPADPAAPAGGLLNVVFLPE